MEEKIAILTNLLNQLIQSTALKFDRNLRRNLPNQAGIYRIYKIDESSITLRAGRTKGAKDGLKQRIYSNHFQGSQSGNICSQLVKNDLASNLSEAKNFLKNNCEVQFLVIEDKEKRKWTEHFMLSVLQPLFCD